MFIVGEIPAEGAERWIFEWLWLVILVIAVAGAISLGWNKFKERRR
jgi:hypothetical protein